MPIPLHTADITSATYVNLQAGNAAALKRELKHWQRAGVFLTAERLKNIGEVKDLILGTKKGTNHKPTSIANFIGKVATVLRRAGAETCGMEEDEWKQTIDRYNEYVRHLRTPYDEGRVAGEGNPIAEPEWVAFAAAVRKAYEDAADTYYAKEFAQKTQEEIDGMRNIVMLVKTVFFYSARSNDATLENFLHPDVDPRRSNMFVCAKQGPPVLIWNERKQDRSKKGKAKPGFEPVDTTSCVQPMTRCPFPNMEGPGFDPQFAAAVISRFYWHSRTNERYLFADRNGDPFFKVTEDGNKDFRPYTDIIKRTAERITGKSYGVSKMRPAQITYLRRNGPSSAAIPFLAEQCHHSKEENDLYTRDANRNASPSSQE